MKKLISVIALVFVMTIVCAVGAYADTGTATVGGVAYSSLNDAISNAQSVDTIVLSAGTFTATNLSGTQNKSITISGAGRDVTFLDMAQNQYVENAVNGASLAFENLTINEDDNIYNGLTHAVSITYSNCKIDGQIFNWSPAGISFNNCEFVQDNPNAYNVWTYAATNISFTNCSFVCAGKSVLVYNENGAGTTATFDVCSFQATQTVSGKAAIEIDSSLLGDPKRFTVRISSSQATGFDSNSVCGNQLWNEKTLSEKTTVYVNNEIKYPFSQVPADPKPDAPVNPAPAPAAPAAPVVENVYCVPGTADHSEMALWGVMAMLLTGTAFFTRKRKTEN